MASKIIGPKSTQGQNVPGPKKHRGLKVTGLIVPPTFSSRKTLNERDLFSDPHLLVRVLVPSRDRRRDGPPHPHHLPGPPGQAEQGEDADSGAWILFDDVAESQFAMVAHQHVERESGIRNVGDVELQRHRAVVGVDVGGEVEAATLGEAAAIRADISAGMRRASSIRSPWAANSALSVLALARSCCSSRAWVL